MNKTYADDTIPPAEYLVVCNRGYSSDFSDPYASISWFEDRAQADKHAAEVGGTVYRK